MATFKSAKTPGVAYREHDTRKHGRQFDKYYVIRYQREKKRQVEALGWASQGWTEKKAGAILFEIKENIRLGKRPQSLAEMRAMADEEQKAKVQEEAVSEAERITLGEVFDRYFEVHKTETVVKTWQCTERYYRKWIAPSLGKRKLIDITVDDIQPIIADVLRVRTTRTADYVKAVCRQIFNFAKRRALYYKDNPAMQIKIKLQDNKRARFLTPEEAKILLDALLKSSQDVHDMALLSLYAGLRAGEIFNLRWEHISWHTERIAIVDPKNGESRFEPMHPDVKAMLLRRKDCSESSYVFVSRNGGKVSDVSDTFQRTVDRLGFNDGITDPRQKVVFHTLRHTYASWLVMSGVDLYTTQKLMGHKNNQMTQRYAHLSPGHLEVAVCKLPTLVRSTK